jgi:integrase
MAKIKPRKNKNGIITSYTIEVYRGRDENGKPLKPWTRSYPDRKSGETIPSGWSQKKIEKEVERIATLFEEECKKGNITVEKITFDKFARQMLDNKSRNGSMKNSSLSISKDMLKKINDIDLDGFGYMDLDSIRVTHINKFYNSLSNPKKKANKHKQKELSAGSIKRYHSFISSVFSYACRQQLINFNPCTYAEKPKSTTSSARDTIKQEDLPNLFKIIDAQSLRTKLASYILLTTGCRVGELLGIQWCDIDFDKNKIFMHNNVQYGKDYKEKKNRIYIDTLKNGDNKTVSVSSYTISLLKKFMEEQKIINPKSEFFVFNQGDGVTPIHPATIRDALNKFKYFGIIKNPVSIEYFNHQNKQTEVIKYKQGDVIRFTDKKVKNQNDIEQYKVIIDNIANNYTFVDCDNVDLLPEHIYPHKFRHTCASMMIYEGLDIASVSKQLGHKKISTTMDIYSHALKRDDDRPASIFDKIISENK